MGIKQINTCMFLICLVVTSCVNNPYYSMSNQDKNGLLVNAILSNDMKGFDKLIDYVDINMKAYDKTPLMLAVKFKREYISRILIQRGANLELTDEDGMTALTLACVDGNESMIVNLLDGGANVNYKTPKKSPFDFHGGKTPLMILCRDKKKFEENSRLVTFLLIAGAKVNEVSADGETALDIAIKTKNTSLVDELRRNGAKTAQELNQESTNQKP